ncbi:MAG: hypothetical protein H6838_15425 [Planctomycetes bacterium]|nr:hypothetical protein [Planctomycetota bacterium]
MRVAALLTLPLLAACEYAYGVQRQVATPANFAFSWIEPALTHHPGFSPAESDVVEGDCLVRDGDALARVSFDGRLLWVGSVWINRQPTPGELSRSLDLQSLLIRAVRAAVPSIPAEEAWQIEWVGMKAPANTVRAADTAPDGGSQRADERPSSRQAQ